MKILKYSVFALFLLSFTSCLKSRNDIGGMLTDNGSILTTIAESEYIDQDNNVIGFGYYANANFSYTTEANEEVKFFTARVTQPRSTKLSGSLKLKITMTSIGGDAIPAGAITIPADYEIPAFSENVKDIPIKLKVNKALLNPAGDYAATFTITAASQGAVSQTNNKLDVYFHNHKFAGRYTVETTVTDPANMVKIYKNTKPVLLDYDVFFGYGPGYLSFVDEYFYGLSGSTQGFSTLVDNLVSGTTAVRYALIYPTFEYNAAGSLTQVYNSLTGASYAVTLNADASNKLVYTSNDNKTFEISYNVTATAPLTSTTTSSRSFKIVEKYTYHPIQVRVF
jgi:hypothetical protein